MTSIAMQIQRSSIAMRFTEQGSRASAYVCYHSTIKTAAIVALLLLASANQDEHTTEAE